MEEKNLLIDWFFSSVQLLSYVQLFATPWIAARQASLSITNSRSSPKPMSIELMIPSNHLYFMYFIQFSSVTQSCLTLCDPMDWKHACLPYPSPTPGGYANSCPSSWGCHPTISSSVIPFSCIQSLQASGSFPVSQVFAWGGQSIGVSASASVLLMNIQGWFPDFQSNKDWLV